MNPQQWPGGTPADLIDDLGHAIAERYRAIEAELEATLRRYAEQALDEPPSTAARLAAIRDLRRQAERLVDTVSPEALARLVTEEAASGASAEIARQLLTMPAYSGAGVAALTQAGALAVAAVELEFRDTLRALNARVLRLPADAYQRMTAQMVPQLLTGLTTSQALHQRMLDRYIAEGITGFVDQGGRRWTIGAYAEMATRTAAARAWRDQSVASMAAHGIQTFTPVIGASACTKCGAWAGKTVTDGGPTGTVTVRHAITGEPVEITVDRTLDEMRAAGWGHPNCRCVLVPSLPGAANPTDYSTHDPQKQADRDELRRLEREVRQAKRDGDADAIGQAQAELRAHVRQTGIRRREYREQLPFADGGFKNPAGATKPTGTVRIPDGLKVEPHELYTAQRLKRYGYHVEFNVPSTEFGVKNPDATIGGQPWEFKSPRGAGKSTISDQFKRAGKQARNVVIDLARCGLPDDDALAQIVRRFRGQSKIQHMLVIQKDGTLTILRPE